MAVIHTRSALDTVLTFSSRHLCLLTPQGDRSTDMTPVGTLHVVFGSNPILLACQPRFPLLTVPVYARFCYMCMVILIRINQVVSLPERSVMM